MNDFEQALTIAEDYQNKTGINVIVGEFGVYEKKGSEEDVSQFLSKAVELTKEPNLTWGYWEYNASFGAFDYTKKNGNRLLLMLYCNKNILVKSQNHLFAVLYASQLRWFLT